jgi:ComF family protein
LISTTILKKTKALNMEFRKSSIFINMELRLLELIQQILGIFLPSNCIICGGPMMQNEKAVHQNCLSGLAKLDDKLLSSFRSELDKAFFDKIFIPFQFSSSFQSMIHNLKYRGFSKIAASFGSYLSEYISAPEYDIITSVPLHKVRERERGFNQSALIAKYFAMSTGLAFDNRLLKRKKNNVSQTSLDRKERIENVFGIFRCTRKVENLKILLIDDVITTGSTVNACSKVLKQSGALKIDIAAMATPADILQRRLEKFN